MPHSELSSLRRRPLLAAPLWLAAAPWSAAAQTPTVGAATGEAAAGHEARRALHALFERYWEETARLSPEWATWRGDHRYGDRWSDRSAAGRAAADAAEDAWLAEAQRIAPEQLGPIDRVSLELFLDDRRRAMALRPFLGYRLQSLRSLWGFQTQLSGLLEAQPVDRPERVQQLLARLAAYPAHVQREMQNLRAAQAAGWVASRPVLERVLAQIDGQLAAPLASGAWSRPLSRLPPSWSEAERARWREAILAALGEHVLPAMKALRAYVADEAMPKAPASGAMRDYPDGARVYERLVLQHTTLPLTAQQVHEIGLRELQRARSEMEAIQRQTRFQGDFAAFVHWLNTDPQFLFKTGEELLSAHRDLAKRLDGEMPRLFAELPRAPYAVNPMPAHLGNAVEYYSGPPLDGSRAGVFYVNVVALAERPKWGMATLVLHEAIPGHHLQTARAIELRALPAFRRAAGYTVYSEGWGLYAETLGYELGLYEDPYSRFGHLQWQAFRAARLVVDSGLHALGWSRQQAVDFMVERTGVDRPQVESEVDRYLSAPGQALSYMIGKLKIVELRERAQAALGARFDLRGFHNALLDQGPVPMPTLERLVEAWVAAEKAKA